MSINLGSCEYIKLDGKVYSSGDDDNPNRNASKDEIREFIDRLRRTVRDYEKLLLIK